MTNTTKSQIDPKSQIQKKQKHDHEIERRLTSYFSREKQWSIYHSLERKAKRRFLKGLPESSGMKVLSELHIFAKKTGMARRFGASDIAKLKTLRRVHALFGRIEG